jgi:RNA polymerase sigma factor (sigma-70 family)
MVRICCGPDASRSWLPWDGCSVLCGPGGCSDGDARQEVHTERDVNVAMPDLTVSHLPADEARSEAAEPLPPEVASQQVVVGDIPAEPPGFRSRAGSLADLDRLAARVSVIHAATGRQGLGASQLAAAYARAKLSAGWRLVAWVNGTDTDSLLAGLAAVADAAGLTDDDPGLSITDAAAAVRHWLETDGDRCLLVFDDVSDPEVLQAFVPAHGTARVVITSTRRSAADLGTAVPVDVFTAAEASAFLTVRTGLDDEAGAAVVAAVLGHLPLALALAAPVIKGQRHGYARYLERLETTPVEQSLTEDDGQPYPHGVARAVLLSLSAIRAADKTGMCSRVLAITAVLPPAGIRRELLHVAGRAGVLAGGGRRVEAALVDQVLDWLSDRSLLTFSLGGQTVMMHGLVARVLRDGLVRGRRLGAVCRVAASVLEAHAIAVAGSQDRPAVRRIPQQVTALLDTAELGGKADEELADILLRLRFISLYHLIELGDSASQAVAVGEPLTADLERLLGPGHPDTLNARNSLAAAYLAADRVADAIPLFEQTLAALQQQLGHHHPDTLTSQNNLASAYQDAGRVAEAIHLYELNLAERERLLGVDHHDALNSRGNLAAAYLAAGRAAEAIPLLEQTLANREGVLGPNHPDTQTSQRNLAKAYQDAGRAAEAIPLLERGLAGQQRILRPKGRAARAIPPIEQTLAARKSQGPARAAGPALPSSFRRPPAGAAGPALPSKFRRPPAGAAGLLPSDRVAGPHARLPAHSPPIQTHNAPVKQAWDDHEVVAAIAAGEPAGIAMAYDRYADALYRYCHWMLHDPADAAQSLQDTFVIAATLGELPEPAKLRSWLFALARSQCRRRIRPGSAIRDEAGAASQLPVQGQPADEVRPAEASDAIREPADATMQFRAVSVPSDAIRESADRTMQFRAVSVPSEGTRESADRTMQFRAVSVPSDAIREPSDATMQFRAVSQLGDATMTFQIVSELPGQTDGLADVNGFLGQAELQALIRSILADMKPREREVVELSFRHDLQDDDLAIVLGMSSSRAHALASHTRDRLEKSFGTLRTALAGRQACPVVGELLAGWDGRLSEQTRDLVAWHIEQCRTCVNQARGALHPTVLSGLLPLASPPPELREEVLSRCYSTAKDAVAYRRRVVRRAESTWAARFLQAVRRVSWKSIRANPGAAIATTAVAAWVAAAAGVLLLTFAGSHAAQAAQPARSPAAHAQTSAATPANSPTTASASATAATSAAARPSPRVTQPSPYVPSQGRPSPSPEGSNTPSKSPSPSPSSSKSPSPSSSSSSSKSSSPSSSSSSSTSPTA